MARLIGRLTALQVDRLTAPGLHPDGGGLYLQISASGARSWILRYTREGKTRYMGLGSVDRVPLKKAREAAADWRALRDRGVDPVDHRKEEKKAARLEAASAISFAECAKGYVAAHEAAWRNPKHRAQWKATLEVYAYPKIGAMAVRAVDMHAVLGVLEPIWHSKPETASRLRGRIEAIIDWATVKQYRTGDNPARWRGHLAKVLPSRSKLRSVRHHPAMPFTQVPSFVATLRAQEGVAAQALLFTILTAARTNETIGARPREFDAAAKLWTVPPERMKANRPHRVPLSEPALATIKSLMRITGDFVFPGGKVGKPLSDAAMSALLERMGHGNVTVHGFRSSFRDWAAERTNYSNEVAEMALAHAIRDKTEAAYRRNDLFEKRRRLMNDWARYCTSDAAAGGGKIVAIGGRRS